MSAAAGAVFLLLK